MGVVLGLIPRWGEGHGQTRAGVCLSSIGMAWVPEKQTRRWILVWGLSLVFVFVLICILACGALWTNARISKCNFQ